MTTTEELRSIDREVAEKVMGWHKEMLPSWPYFTADGVRTKFSEYGETAWHPATNIAQAFEVVERMRELNWKFELSIRARGVIPYHSWFIKDDGTYGNLPHGESMRKSLPETICLAAIKAIEPGREG